MFGAASPILLVLFTMSSSVARKVVNVKIVSDVVWPFCFVGLRNLQKASDTAGVDYHLQWEPFLLNPSSSLPEEGEPIEKHLEKKYGAAAMARFKGPNNPLKTAGEKVGIKFTNDRNIYPTVKAHALLEKIKEQDNNKANAMMEALFQSYFEEGQNINDPEKLADMAEKVTGLDKNQALQAIRDTNLQDQVRAKDHMYKSQMRVTGVPFYIIEQNSGGRPMAFSGAQPPEMIAEMLEEAADV